MEMRSRVSWSYSETAERVSACFTEYEGCLADLEMDLEVEQDLLAQDKTLLHGAKTGTCFFVTVQPRWNLQQGIRCKLHDACRTRIMRIRRIQPWATSTNTLVILAFTVYPKRQIQRAVFRMQSMTTAT